jgi:uncharacterized protein YjbI with pentapeptide repeats
MANPEHLEVIRQGVEQWNRWRKSRSETRPDLAGGDLQGLNLREANLRWGDLSGVNLRRADLTNAAFRKAKLPALI